MPSGFLRRISEEVSKRIPDTEELCYAEKDPKSLRESVLTVFETFQSKRLVQPDLLTFPSSKGSVTSVAVLPAPALEPAAFPRLSHAPAAHPSAGDGFCPDINASGRTRAQSVTQPDVHITVSEGAPLELRCNYSSSLPLYLFWYMQYPNQGLQLLLKNTSGNSLVSGIKSFEAEFKMSETSFHLRKPSALGNDLAEYFCALMTQSAWNCRGS
nr:uncharacterized protein LOC106840746 [Equus asinus]